MDKMPKRSPKPASKLRPPRTNRKPLTYLQTGQAVVDARGIVRTIPTSQKRLKQGDDLRLKKGIERKLESKKGKPIHEVNVPKTMKKQDIIKILIALGFNRAGSDHFTHPKLGRVQLPSSTDNLSVRAHRGIRKQVELFLRSGGKL